MNTSARRLLLIGALVGLAGCKSLLSGRPDAAERPSEVALAFYVTERANPNPQAPLESEPAKPAVRVELSGDSLDDVAAQLAAMTKLVEQERKNPGSVPKRSASPIPAQETTAAIADDVTALQGSVATRDFQEETESSAVYDSTEAPLAGLPSTAVFEHAQPVANSGEDTPMRALGAYGGEHKSDEATSVSSTLLHHAKPSPIAIKVIQLRDDSILLNADFDALASDLKKALGSTYLRHDDYLLKPGQYKTAPLRHLEKEAAYIGVVASYHDLDLSEWKAVRRIESAGGRYALLMVFDEHGIKIRTEVQH